jgi:hypothetical protein
LLIQCPLWNCGSLADSYHWGSVPHGLGMQGLIVGLYCTVSLSPVCIVSHEPFSVFSEASTSTCLQKGRRKRLMPTWRRLRACLLIACKANPATRLSFPAIKIGGPVQDLSNFQMTQIPFLGDLTCSTHSPHDILTV